MKIDIYKFEEYKSYLALRIKSDGRITRGVRQKMSDFVGCQPSYLSQVLNGKPHFTLEQAYRLNEFFLHDRSESQYFMLLVEHGRAGSRELKNFFLDQILDAKKNRMQLKNRLKNTEDIPEQVRHQYYSAWFYAAIHVILSIPEYQDAAKIASRLNLPIDLVVKTIRFLENSGLIEQKQNSYKFTKRSIHLGADSEFIQRHHINWRSQALQSAEKNLPNDLHYSNVIALSKSDSHNVKEVFLCAIEEARAIVKPSKEEEIFTVTLDFFRL